MIAASAGNHAQGVAYHATRNGVRSTIVMPAAAPLVKVTRTREYGAEVVLHGASYDEAFEEAWRRREAEGLTFIHAFDDDAVMAGQGTVGLELLEQNPYLEAVLVPIGGGGLISGIAVAMKEINPRVRIIGVQTSRLPSMVRAVSEHAPVTLPAAVTIADGIAVRRAGARTLPVVSKYVDDIVTVDEEEIANAILLLLEREKTVAEGAGAAAMAALMQNRANLSGKKVAVAHRRRQHRRQHAVAHHRARPRQGWAAGTLSRAHPRSPGRAAQAHRRDRVGARRTSRRSSTIAPSRVWTSARRRST